MKFDYQYKITFSLDEPFDVNYVNNVCIQHPDKKILVEVQNTKGITSSQLRNINPNIGIRIAGGYNEERIKNKGNIIYNNGENGKYYTEAVIYTRNETIKIIEEIEKIESGINKNWSEFQKLIYIYDRLKSGIMYDPKFEYKLSSEIRSLRGLITKQTVCAGYSMILKEFMDRQGIKCEYVEGKTKNGGHAWNIINIDGKKYPIDLTLDNTKFRSGKFNTFDFLGKDIDAFSETHIPDSWEPTQNYKKTLSQIDPKLVKQIYYQIGLNRARDYRSTTYYGTRKDGSKYIVSQIGNATIDNQEYYRYYYVDIANDGTKKQPLILYSDDNLTNFINYKNFRIPIRKDCSSEEEYNQKLKAFHEKIKTIDNAVSNILFSKKNIDDSIAQSTYYIGSIKKKDKTNKVQYITSHQEINKPKEKNSKFTYPTKCFTRSNGTIFIAQQMLEEPFEVKGVKVMRYDIFEMVNENGKNVLKRNTVFTERNFFVDQRQSMIDDYLSRSRLDRKVDEAGGYIGYYDVNGIRTYNPDLVSYFETSKKIDINSLNKSVSQSIPIPTFNEIKDLSSRYEIFIDSKDPFDADTSKIKIRNINTGQIETDPNIISKAMFANIWLSSAGIKWTVGEKRSGIDYAFNEPAEELYNLICKELLNYVKLNGVIDTVNLFKNIEAQNDYKYNQEIIVNLFRSSFQTNFINELFLKSIGITQKNKLPEPLYTISYAGEMAYSNSGKSK